MAVELSRQELLQGFNYLVEQGRDEDAQLVLNELRTRPLTFAETMQATGGMISAGSETFPTLGTAFLTTDETLNRFFSGEGLPGGAATEAAIKEQRNKFIYEYGFMPDTPVQWGPANTTVGAMLDSAAGFGPSATFSVVGLAAPFIPLPGTTAAALAGIGAATYNMAVNQSAYALADVLVNQYGYNEEKTREIVTNVMPYLRGSGLAEGASEAVGDLGVGKLLQFGLKKLMPEAGEAVFKSVMKKMGVVGGTTIGGIGVETLEEVTGGLASGEALKAAEKEAGIKTGEIGGAEASVERAKQIASDVLPMVTVLGGGPSAAISTYRSFAPAQEETTASTGNARPLTHESGNVRKAVDFVADTFGRKSISVLKPYIGITGEGSAAAQLHDMIEHRETGEAVGVVKQPDFFETKLNELGDIYNRVDNSLNRLRDSFTGRSLKKGTRQNLQRYIETGVKLKGIVGEAVQAAKANDFSKINKLRGKQRQLAETALAGDTIRDAVAEINYRLESVGVQQAYSTTAGGMPLFFDTSRIRNNRQGFKSWLQQDGYASNDVHAQEITENILNAGGVPYLNEPTRHKSLRKTDEGEKPGVVNKPINPSTVPKQFVNENIEKALPNFALKAATRIAHAKTFGANGEKLDGLVKQMIQEVREAGHTVNDQDIKQIYNIQNALIGTYNPIRQAGVQRANKAATVFQAASTLGGATLSSIQEPLVIFERAGLIPALKTLPAALSQAARGIIRSATSKKWMKQHDMMRVAEELGIAQEYANAEILTQTFSAEHASMLDTFFKSPFGLFLYQWTRWVRAWATGASMAKFDQYQREFNSGKISTLTKQQLADLGFSTQDFASLVNVAKAANVKLSEVLKRNATDPNVVTETVLDTQLPSGKTGRELLRAGTLRMVNESVMAPRATVRPMWLNDPHFALIGELKSFPIVFGNTVIKRLINKIDPRKMKCGGSAMQAMGALSAAAAMVGVAYLMQEVKFGIWGSGEDPERRMGIEYARTPKEAAESRFGEAIQTSGMLGPWQMLVDTYRFDETGILGPSMNQMFDAMTEIVKFGENEYTGADMMRIIGERTAKAAGSFGKSQQVREAVGDWAYDIGADLTGRYR